MVQEYMKLLLVSFYLCAIIKVRNVKISSMNSTKTTSTANRGGLFAPVATPSVWVGGQLANRRLSRPTNEKLAQ